MFHPKPLFSTCEPILNDVSFSDASSALEAAHFKDKEARLRKDEQSRTEISCLLIR